MDHQQAESIKTKAQEKKKKTEGMEVSESQVRMVTVPKIGLPVVEYIFSLSLCVLEILIYVYLMW